MREIRVAVGAIIVNDLGEVLIGKRGSNASDDTNLWDFFGGKVDIGEKTEDATKREIKEELGVDIEITKLINLVEKINDSAHWIGPCYICKIVSGEPKIMEDEKFSEIKWVNLSEIEKYKLTEPGKQNLEAYMDTLL